MKLFLVILVVCVASCAPKSHTFRITGGEIAEDGQFPYQVSIHYEGSHNCGGSIISADSILTAGHCLWAKISNQLTVAVGTNKNNEGVRHSVINHYWHPHFNYISLENDVGIVKLSTKISYNDRTLPIALETVEVGDNIACVVSGWGYTAFPESATPVDLHYVDLITYPLSNCRSNSLREVFDTNICTFTRYGQGTCYGDSGSPLVANDKQIGIVSWGQPCGVGYPDVFTKVAAFSDWIKEEI
ncbi:hypothetical protein FQA39_LY15723 [Lamprigera yunnana]|nr:hypothetical protein FQA39_LY15723 [Lamprigera yunnana]